MRGRARHPPAWLRAPAAAVVLTLVACEVGTGGPPAEGEGSARPSEGFTVERLDLPPLDGLPERARADLERLRSELDRLAGEDGASEAALATAVGRLGMAYQRFELPDPALACLRAAGRLAPGQPRWPYYEGYVLAGRGELDAAAGAFERARTLDPEATWTLLRLADVELDRGRLQQAEALYRRVLELRPDAPAAHYGLARAAQSAGAVERAIAGFRAALDAAPEATRVHHLLAQAYRRAGREDEARRAVARAGSGEVPRHDPPIGELRAQDSSAGLVQQAQRELRSGRRAEAERLLRAAVAEDPDDATARYNLAVVLEEADRLEDAERQYRAVLARDGSFTRARHGLGTLLAQAGRLDEAVSELSAAVRQAPDFVQARLNLAAALARLGRWAEAVDQYEAVAALDPDRREVRILLAGSLLEAGRAREAATAFAELVAEEPGRPLLRLKEAEALIAAEEYGQARGRLESGLAAHPQSGELANALARLLAAAPDPEVRDPARALELARGLYRARADVRHGRTFAMALAASGRHGEAAALLERWLAEAQASEELADLRPRLEAELRRYRRGEPAVHDRE